MGNVSQDRDIFKDKTVLDAANNLVNIIALKYARENKKPVTLEYNKDGLLIARED